MEMWLIALLGAFFVILMILLGFCIAYCCLRNDKNKNLSYEYSSPRNHAFDVSFYRFLVPSNTY